jgi:hypothetical protein
MLILKLVQERQLSLSSNTIFVQNGRMETLLFAASLFFVLKSC